MYSERQRQRRRRRRSLVSCPTSQTHSAVVKSLYYISWGQPLSSLCLVLTYYHHKALVFSQWKRITAGVQAFTRAVRNRHTTRRSRREFHARAGIVLRARDARCHRECWCCIPFSRVFRGEWAVTSRWPRDDEIGVVCDSTRPLETSDLLARKENQQNRTLPLFLSIKILPASE